MSHVPKNTNPLSQISSVCGTTHQPMDLPNSVRGAVSKPHERAFLCLLEEQLLLLINRLCSDKQALHIIPALVLRNSYYRLLGHQLCQHYSLQHWNNPQNGIVVSGSDWVDYHSVKSDVDNGKVALVSGATIKPPTILKRAESAIDPSSGGNAGPSPLLDALRAGRTAKEALYRQKRDEILLKSDSGERSSHYAPNQPNWPLQPRISSAENQGYYPYAYQPFYAPPNAYPMDPETERKLLNNPYIIMPQDASRGRRRRRQQENAYNTYPFPYGYSGYPVYSEISQNVPYSAQLGPAAQAHVQYGGFVIPGGVILPPGNIYGQTNDISLPQGMRLSSDDGRETSGSRGMSARRTPQEDGSGPD